MHAVKSNVFSPGLCLVFLALTPIVSIGADPGQFGTPKGDEGTRIFKATEHPNYSGQFRLTGGGTVLVGSMRDLPPWDHLDYNGKRLNPVPGRISIEVDERANTGVVLVEFAEGTDRYRIVFDRFAGTAPYQDGGIATRVYEHGDSGNGDPLYPKTWLYLAGWGKSLDRVDRRFRSPRAHTRGSRSRRPDTERSPQIGRRQCDSGLSPRRTPPG